jgi:hypothetical protein
MSEFHGVENVEKGCREREEVSSEENEVEQEATEERSMTVTDRSGAPAVQE